MVPGLEPVVQSGLAPVGGVLQIYNARALINQGLKTSFQDVRHD